MQKPRTSTIIVLILLFIILVIVAWFTYQAVTDSKEASSDAGQALFGGEDSEERFISVAGTPVAVNELVGEQALYINSWASWSPLSRDELIALNTVAGEFRDKGITFIALNRKEPREQAESYLATLPPLDNLVVVIDSTDEFYGQVGGYAMPETLFYSTQGDLYRHERQPLTAESMRAIVTEFLAAE